MNRAQGNNVNCYDYGARFYDPALGRWHVADPMEQYDSPYIYVGNNPVSFIDPSGMFGEDYNNGLYKTVVDRSGTIIYHDPNDPDKGIYESPDGIQGRDGNTDGLMQIGVERPDQWYYLGWKILDFEKIILLME